jgi:mRNA-degrading endonuclease YafQ of YafQ-DinJ toxin-antitoxin module
MREIEQSNAFKKDTRREGKGPNLAALNVVLSDILAALANDIQLRVWDRTANCMGYSELFCHISEFTYK